VELVAVPYVSLEVLVAPEVLLRVPEVDVVPDVLPVSKLPVEPDWLRRVVSEPLLPVAPVLPAPLVWAKVVAAPSNTTIADANSVRRAGEME